MENMVDLVVIAQGLVQQYGILGIFIANLLFNASIILPLPGDLMVFTAGALASQDWLFNPFVIGIVAGLAAAIGELTAYAVGWGTDKHVLKKRHGKKYRMAKDYLDKHGFVAIVVFALTPLPMDVMGLLAGALRYDVHDFFIASLCGKIPRNWILAYAGYYGVHAVLNFFQLVF